MNPRQLLESYHILPKKSLGQNFLHDPNALEKIVSIADVTHQDAVLEVGPGTGALTDVLARHARRVVAVEVDERFQPILATRFGGIPQVEIVYGDILAQSVATLLGADAENYIVVANVPYYITSAIVRHVLEQPSRPRRLVLTMQLEVAQKMIARPGEMSLLSVSAQFYGQVRIVARFPPAVFYPRPDVDSAVIRLDVADQPVVNTDETVFFRVARAGFSQKRKQIKNSLASGLNLSAAETQALLEKAGIDPQRRPETLTLEEWAALANAYQR
jgi:16S rRNA (adenine1518-N6/adenine1519-N6)-dimethyltransferase